MGFARQVADRVVFMDAGEIVEVAPPAEFFTRPESERTQRFLAKFSRLGNGRAPSARPAIARPRPDSSRSEPRALPGSLRRHAPGNDGLCRA